MPFPSPSSSGDQVLGECTLPRCGGASYHLSGLAAQFPGCAAGATSLRCAVCLLWGADLWLRPSWWISTVQVPRKTWLAPGSLLTVWERMRSLGLSLTAWTGACQASLSITSCPSWSLLRLMSTELSLSPPSFNLSQHQGLFKCVSSSHQVAKGLEFQLHHQSFQ